MKKILFISNIGNGKVGSFSKNSIGTAKELGLDFYLAMNYSNASKEDIKEEEKKYGIKMKHIDFIRNPFDFRNIRAYKQLLSLMKQEKFDIVHCNTPIGGILGRICAKKAKVPKVIYTAHGFHFYKGAPLINNLIYKNVERMLAKQTDLLITMNQEDYEAAQKFKLRKNGKVMLVHGVGMDSKNYEIENFNVPEYRKQIGVKEDDIVIISAGDLIKRKNYEIAIKAINECKKENIKYLICGTGPEESNLKSLAKELGINEQIQFLGYRNDIKELMNCSDIFLFTTKQEGMPRSMMEAMSAGLPCVASKIRGNVDLLEDKKGGFLNSVNKSEEFANSLLILANDKSKREKMGKFNKEAIKKFDTENVKKELLNIYKMIEEN